MCIDPRTALEQSVTMSSIACKTREHQKIVTKYSYFVMRYELFYNTITKSHLSRLICRDSKLRHASRSEYCIPNIPLVRFVCMCRVVYVCLYACMYACESRYTLMNRDKAFTANDSTRHMPFTIVLPNLVVIHRNSNIFLSLYLVS